MFSRDIATQSVKFGRELDEIVAVIPRFDKFVDRTASLGARHANYGVRPSHYDLRRDALVATLAETLGDDVPEEMREAWMVAFALVAESMQLGAVPRRA